jgi:hypothetical protein
MNLPSRHTAELRHYGGRREAAPGEPQNFNGGRLGVREEVLKASAEIVQWGFAAGSSRCICCGGPCNKAVFWTAAVADSKVRASTACCVQPVPLIISEADLTREICQTPEGA